MKLHDKYERTGCECHQCVSVCKAKPGSCAPGDVTRIANYIGSSDVYEFAMNNFRASPGTDVNFHGTRMTLPVIVPAQHSDGRCVFLGDDDQCLVYPVAPFGCTRVNQCGSGSQKRWFRRALFAMLSLIQKSPMYMLLWARLDAAGRTVRPDRERDGDLRQQILLAEAEMAETGGAEKTVQK